MAASKGTRILMETKKRTILLYNEKKSAGQIQKVLLQKYGERVSRQGVYMFLKKWKEDQVLTRKKRGKCEDQESTQRPDSDVAEKD